MEIVYEDNHLLIVVKPPNLLTQGDSTGDICLTDMAKRYIRETYNKPGEAYLGLVHRLDRPVGGLVALVKTSKAASRLTEQLKKREMKREYLCVVEGLISAGGERRDWLIKDEPSGGVTVLSEQREGAREASLYYEPVDATGDTTLCRIRLDTGRKHQIRAQMKAMGHPIVYDMRYGRGEKGMNIALWGAMLRLRHPTLGTDMRFTSKPRGAAFDKYISAAERVLTEFQEGE